MRFSREYLVAVRRALTALCLGAGAAALSLSAATVARAGVAMEVGTDGASVKTPAYQAAFDATGTLVDLEVKGEHYVTKPKGDALPMYFYRGALIPLASLRREDDRTLVSEGPGVRVTWTFLDDEIRVELRNMRRTPVSTFVIFASDGAVAETDEPARVIFRRGSGLVGLIGGDTVPTFRGQHAWRAELRPGETRPVRIVFSEQALAAVPEWKTLAIAAPDERLVTPWRGLVYTPADIATMRAVARVEERFQPAIRSWFTVTERWLAFSEEELDRLLPANDAVFADGWTSGDPKTDQNWPKRGGGLCSLDRPGEVRSPHTGDVYGIQKKGELYYDPGDGWVRPEDGKRFYFKGVWHSYVIGEALAAVQAMEKTWMLTGDERVAERMLFLMDRMASMRASRGDRDGPADWPYPLRINQGFFCFEGNQANTQLYMLCLSLDLVAKTPAATPERMARIREHLLRVVEPDSMKHLQNHGLSAWSAYLARALLFAEADGVREGIGATCAFLDNCVDRDGEYYEVAASYGGLGYGYGGRLVELLRNYSPGNYSEGERAGLPERSEFPLALEFGNDPRWLALAVTSKIRLGVFGRTLNYGDSWPDREVRLESTTRERAALRDAILYVHDQTSRADWKAELAGLYWALPAYLRERPTFGRAGSALWLEPPKPEGAANAPVSLSPGGSILLGGKVTALLRGGEGAGARALFMRGGHAESHAHDDQMAIALYGRGMLLSGEFGYGYWGTPDHVGFGTRAVSHKTVVVDEDLPSSDALYRDAPSASVTAFVPGGPARMVGMSNPSLWPKASRVSEYSRQAWLVDVGADNFYAIDIFRVEGGRTHDYVWNAPFLSPARDDDGFSLEGVEPKPVPGAWTLAAQWNEAWRDAEWNRPGRSWGERIIGRTGRLLDQPPETLGKRWNPPPGNGYGFIYDIKAAEARAPWSADWDLHDNRSRLRLTMLTPDGVQTVVSGRSGSLETGHQHALVVARRRATKAGEILRSRFVSLAQAADLGGAWPVRDFRSLDISGGHSFAVAVEAVLNDGSRDRILSAPDERTRVQAEGSILVGGSGFVRHDERGRLAAALLSGGLSLEASGIRIEAEAASLGGRVVSVETGAGKNRVLAESAPEAGLEGVTVLFSSPKGAGNKYPSNEYYRTVSSSRTDGRGALLDLGAEQSLVLSGLEVTKVDGAALELRWPNMTGGTRRMQAFAGRLAVAADGSGRSAPIEALLDRQRVRLSGKNPFRAGDRLEVRAVQPGDVWKIPAAVRVDATGRNEWRISANLRAVIELAVEGEGIFSLYSGEGGRLPVEATAHRGRLRVEIDPGHLGGGEFLLKAKSL